MLDGLKDGGMTLAEAVKVIPKVNGKALNVTTVWRWCRHGIKSRNGECHRLAHGRCGKRLIVTQEALDQFFADVAEGDLEQFDRRRGKRVKRKQPTPAKRKRQIEEARLTLKKAGII